MKKFFLFCLSISLAIHSFAQSGYINVPANFNNGITRSSAESGIPYAKYPIVSSQSPSQQTRGSETIIGTTTYDNEPSNQRLFPGPNGSLTATWTGSTSLVPPGPTDTIGWPDRGTFYNYFDGSNWTFASSPYDAVRLEPVRSGFPSNVILANGHERVFSHIPVDTALGTITRTTGSGAWTATAPSSPLLSVMWPHATAYGDTVFVIGANNKNYKTDYLEFSRSTDGGNTWGVLNSRLPQEDTTDCIPFMFADAYAIDANKSTIAIVSGGIENSVFLWKSTDNGNTWNRSLIVEYPRCGGYKEDYLTGPTEVTAGDFALLVDNNGRVHVWYSDLFMANSDSTDNLITLYYPTTKTGIRYWNDSLPTNVGLLIASDPDTINTGLGTCALYGPLGIGSSYAIMPTAAIDTTTKPNTLYCVFAEAVPGSQIDGNPNAVAGQDTTAHSFHDLFGVYSTDGGNTWSNQANLTNSALSSQKENVFPSASRYANGNHQVNVIWMQGTSPGSYVLNPSVNQSISTNNIDFSAFGALDFSGTKTINKAAQNVNVYPNPSSGIFNINLNGFNAGDKGNVTVENILGETVKTYNNVSLTSNIQLKAAGLTNGLYFIKIQTSNSTITGKVIISNN